MSIRSFSKYRRLLVTIGAGALLALSVGGVSVASADVIHCDRPDRHGEFDCTVPTPPPPPASSQPTPNAMAQPETPCSEVLQATAQNDKRMSPGYAQALGASLNAMASVGGHKPPIDYASVLTQQANQPGPDYQKICEQATAAALPVPAVSANDRYSTSNGVKTSQQIQTELITSGYAGPFDVPSLLAAYQRTTSSPVRPV